MTESMFCGRSRSGAPSSHSNEAKVSTEGEDGDHQHHQQQHRHHDRHRITEQIHDMQTVSSSIISQSQRSRFLANLDCGDETPPETIEQQSNNKARRALAEAGRLMSTLATEATSGANEKGRSRRHLRQINIVGQINHSASNGLLFIIMSSMLALLLACSVSLDLGHLACVEALSWPLFSGLTASKQGSNSEATTDASRRLARNTRPEGAGAVGGPLMPSQIAAAFAGSPAATTQQFHYFWNHDSIEPQVVASEANRILADAQLQTDQKLMEAQGSASFARPTKGGQQGRRERAPASHGMGDRRANKRFGSNAMSSPGDTSNFAGFASLQGAASTADSFGSSPSESRQAIPPIVQQQLISMALQMQRQQQASAMLQPRFDSPSLSSVRARVSSASPPPPLNPMSRYWGAAAASNQHPVIARAPPTILNNAAAAQLLAAESSALASNQLVSTPFGANQANFMGMPPRIAGAGFGAQLLTGSRPMAMPSQGGPASTIGGVPVYGPFAVTPSIPILASLNPFGLNAFAGQRQAAAAVETARATSHPTGNRLASSLLSSRRHRSRPAMFGGGSSSANDRMLSAAFAAAASQAQPTIVAPPTVVSSARVPPALLDVASSQLLRALAGQAQVRAAQERLAKALARALDAQQPQQLVVPQSQQQDLQSAASFPSAQFAMSSTTLALGDPIVGQQLKQQQVADNLQPPHLIPGLLPGAAALAQTQLLSRQQQQLAATLFNGTSPPYGSRLKRRHLNALAAAQNSILLATSSEQPFSKQQPAVRKLTISPPYEVTIAPMTMTTTDQSEMQKQLATEGQQMLIIYSENPIGSSSATPATASGTPGAKFGSTNALELKAVGRKATMQQTDNKNLNSKQTQRAPSMKASSFFADHQQHQELKLDQSAREGGEQVHLRRLKRAIEEVEPELALKKFGASDWIPSSSSTGSSQSLVSSETLTGHLETQTQTQATWPSKTQTDTVAASSGALLAPPATSSRSSSFVPLARRQAELSIYETASGQYFRPTVKQAQTPPAGNDGDNRGDRQEKRLKIKRITASASVLHHPPSTRIVLDKANGISLKRGLVLPGSPQTSDPMSSSLSESTRVVNYFQNVDHERSLPSSTGSQDSSSSQQQQQEIGDQHRAQSSSMGQQQAGSVQVSSSEQQAQPMPTPQINVGYSAPLMSPPKSIGARTTSQQRDELFQHQQQPIGPLAQPEKGDSQQQQSRAGNVGQSQQQSNNYSSTAQQQQQQQPQLGALGYQESQPTNQHQRQPQSQQQQQQQSQQQSTAAANSADISSAATGTQAYVNNMGANNLLSQQAHFQRHQQLRSIHQQQQQQSRQLQGQAAAIAQMSGRQAIANGAPIGSGGHARSGSASVVVARISLPAASAPDTQEQLALKGNKLLKTLLGGMSNGGGATQRSSLPVFSATSQLSRQLVLAPDSIMTNKQAGSIGASQSMSSNPQQQQIATSSSQLLALPLVPSSPSSSSSLPAVLSAGQQPSSAPISSSSVAANSMNYDSSTSADQSNNFNEEMMPISAMSHELPSPGGQGGNSQLFNAKQHQGGILAEGPAEQRGGPGPQFNSLEHSDQSPPSDQSADSLNPMLEFGGSGGGNGGGSGSDSSYGNRNQIGGSEPTEFEQNIDLNRFNQNQIQFHKNQQQQNQFAGQQTSSQQPQPQPQQQQKQQMQQLQQLQMQLQQQALSSSQTSSSSSSSGMSAANLSSQSREQQSQKQQQLGGRFSSQSESFLPDIMVDSFSSQLPSSFNQNSASSGAFGQQQQQRHQLAPSQSDVSTQQLLTAQSHTNHPQLQQFYSQQVQAALGAYNLELQEAAIRNIQQQQQQQENAQTRNSMYSTPAEGLDVNIQQQINNLNSYQPQMPHSNLYGPEEEAAVAGTAAAAGVPSYPTAAQLMALQSQGIQGISDMSSLIAHQQQQHQQQVGPEQREHGSDDSSSSAAKGGGGTKKAKRKSQQVTHYHFNNFGSPFEDPESHFGSPFDLSSPIQPTEGLSIVSNKQRPKAVKLEEVKAVEEEEKPKKKRLLRRFSLKNLFKKLKKDKKEHEYEESQANSNHNNGNSSNSDNGSNNHASETPEI